MKHQRIRQQQDKAANWPEVTEIMMPTPIIDTTKQASSMKRRIALIAGLSLSTIMVAGNSGAMVAFDDEEKVEKTEEKKVEKKKIRVIRSGGPVTVIRDSKDGEKIEIQKHVSVHIDEERQKAIVETKEALEKVNARLEKARKKEEKRALEAAKDGLETALEALESKRSHMTYAYAGPSHAEIRRIEIDAMEGALKDMEEQVGDLGRIRIELKEDLIEAREDIREAFEDIELEFEFDAEARERHVIDLDHAARSLDQMEEQQLEGLRQAEEHLKRERERLEQRLAERRAKALAEDVKPE